jgi:hypothetical protein
MAWKRISKQALSDKYESFVFAPLSFTPKGKEKIKLININLFWTKSMYLFDLYF